MPDGLQPLTQGLIEDSTATKSAGGDIAREIELDDLPRIKMPNEGEPTNKHNVFTHFSQDPNRESCRMCKTTRARCQNRPDMSRYGLVATKKFGAVTTDYKVLGEDSESRLQRWYAVVVHNIFYWIRSYPTWRKSEGDTETSLQQSLPPSERRGRSHVDNYLEFWFVLVKI